MLRDRPVRALTVGNLNIVCGIVTLLTVRPNVHHRSCARCARTGGTGHPRVPKKINESGPLSAWRPAHFGRRQINGRRNPSEIREIERVSCAQKFRATFFAISHSTDRLVPAVVWERDDQMSGPSEGLATPMANGDGERPPVTRGGLDPPPRSRPRVTARDVSPFVPWLSRKVACREAPSNHPCDARVRAAVGNGVDPRARTC